MLSHTCTHAERLCGAISLIERIANGFAFAQALPGLSGVRTSGAKSGERNSPFSAYSCAHVCYRLQRCICLRHLDAALGYLQEKCPFFEAAPTPRMEEKEGRKAWFKKILQQQCSKEEYAMFLKGMYHHWHLGHRPGQLLDDERTLWNRLCADNPELKDLEYRDIVDPFQFCHVHDEPMEPHEGLTPKSHVAPEDYLEAKSRLFPRACDWRYRVEKEYQISWNFENRIMRGSTCAEVAKEWRQTNYPPETKLVPIRKNK